MSTTHLDPRAVSFAADSQTEASAPTWSTGDIAYGPNSVPRPACPIVRADIKFLSPLLVQLHEVKSMEATVDEPAATLDAYLAAREMLIHAAILAGEENRRIPSGCVTTDDRGGIRIEWFRPGVRVHLVIPESRQRPGYVYHQRGDEYGTEPASDHALAKWLKFIPDSASSSGMME